MGDDPHRFRVEVIRDQGRTVYRVFGTIDEHADLDRLAGSGGDTSIEVDLQNVHRFNSYGVRAWIFAMRRVHDGVSMTFTHCPPLVIDQLNMVDGMMGRAAVSSFYAPRACAACDARSMQFLKVADCHAHGGKLIDQACSSCGDPMELDDIEERYLFLLRNNPPVDPPDDPQT